MVFLSFDTYDNALKNKKKRRKKEINKTKEFLMWRQQWQSIIFFCCQRKE
jgi:hypothetical protein